MRGEIESLLLALNEGGVRYLVVGGLAVVLHGHLRTTMDLDLVVHLEPENLERALRVFDALGYQPVPPVPLLHFADPEIRESWIRDKNMIVFSLWKPDRPQFKLDLFVSEPFDFGEIYGRAVRVNLGEAEATVVALEDLMEMKREAGRPQDVADLQALEELRRKRKEST